MGQLATAIHTAAQRIPAAPVADPAALLTGPQLAAIFAQVEAAVAALELRAAGSQIRSNTGPPSNNDGNDFDLYLNTANGDLWGKDAGAWSFLLNTRGPQGIQGVQGATGAQGDRGLKGDKGTAGTNGTNGRDGTDGTDGRDGTRIRLFAATPVASDGNLDDVAIVSTTGDLLEKTASGWAVRGNVKGPQGDTGAAGAAGAAGAGGTGTSPAGATVPPGGTTGQVLTKTSNADGAAAWQTPNAGNAVAWDYALGNTSAPPPIDFRRATQLTLVGRSSGIASASYAVNGGSPQPFVFTNNLDQRGISIPAGGQLVLSAVNFQGGAPSGTLFFEGTQS